MESIVTCYYCFIRFKEFEHVALLQAAALLVENGKAALQSLAEAGLLELERLGHQRLGADQLRISLSHLAHQRRHELPHQRIAGPEQLGVSHGAAHDAAEHITAPFVRRQHAVGDQEGRRAQMVGDDPERGDGLLLRSSPEGGRGRIDQMTEQIGLEDAVDALQNAGHALQSHPGVDRGARQRLALLLRHLLELHEDQVPELEETIAVLVGAARWSAPDMLATVDEYLRARTARAGIAHRPEIIRGRNADDAVVRETCDFLPVARGLIVVVVNGDEQLVLLQAQLFRDQGPGQFDRALLEVIAEREVTEHLKEGEMTRGVADIVEVVVLAAGAHALLRGGGALIRPLLDAGKDVLELHHAGIGEHQGRVVARHKRRRRHDFMAVLGKIVEERGSDVVDAAHVCSIHPVARVFASSVAANMGLPLKF